MNRIRARNVSAAEVAAEAARARVRPKLPERIIAPVKARTAELMRKVEEGDASAFRALYGREPNAGECVARTIVRAKAPTYLSAEDQCHVERAVAEARKIRKIQAPIVRVSWWVRAWRWAFG